MLENVVMFNLSLDDECDWGEVVIRIPRIDILVLDLLHHCNQSLVFLLMTVEFEFKFRGRVFSFLGYDCVIRD